MDPLAFTEVHFNYSGEYHQGDRFYFEDFMSRELQRERVAFKESLPIIFDKLIQRSVRAEKEVHLRINSVEESLQKKINNLEQQLTTKTNHFEQRIQEMEVQNRIPRGRKSQRGRNEMVNSCLKSPRGIAERRGLLQLTEGQLEALMKGSDCVRFIGKLVLSSFPEDYFMERKYRFAKAISSQQIDALFEIVSSKFTVIKRRNHPQAKTLTKEEMIEVIRSKVAKYRSRNRNLIN